MRVASAHLEPVEEATRGEEVLLGEHLGRDHEGALVAALHAVKKRRERDHGLAGADVALQEPVHRVRSGEVGRHLPDRPLLGCGQLEGQAAEERLDEARRRPQAA